MIMIVMAVHYFAVCATNGQIFVCVCIIWGSGAEEWHNGVADRDNRSEPYACGRIEENAKILTWNE